MSLLQHRHRLRFRFAGQGSGRDVCCEGRYASGLKEFLRYCLSSNLMNTPKAFANSSPGFEHRENPGDIISNRDPTLKGLGDWRTLFRVQLLITFGNPGLSYAQPRAEISERLRRIHQIQNDALLFLRALSVRWRVELRQAK